MPYPQLYYEQLSGLPEGDMLDLPDIKFFANTRKHYIFLACDAQVISYSLRTDAGWKFQISIDDTIETNLARAWNVVVDILVDRQISQSKVIRGEVHLSGGDPAENDMDLKFAERGKQIVIYAYDADIAKPWGEILQRIAQGLVGADIQPSYLPPYNRPIFGSYYISYRNDADQRGGKYPAKYLDRARKEMRDKGYNPHGHFDHFGKLRLDIDLHGKEIVIPKWGENVAHYCERKVYDEDKMVRILMGLDTWSMGKEMGVDKGGAAADGATSGVVMPVVAKTGMSP